MYIFNISKDKLISIPVWALNTHAENWKLYIHYLMLIKIISQWFTIKSRISKYTKQRYFNVFLYVDVINKISPFVAFEADD